MSNPSKINALVNCESNGISSSNLSIFIYNL